MPLLMVGGLYLCYEGVEKLAHHFWPHEKKTAGEAAAELSRLAVAPPGEVKQSEADKIKGAVRTDFVLSAEIIAITLGTVAGQAFGKQVLVLSAIALVMTVGVYGLVAGIVKLDDAGLYLSQRQGPMARRFGRLILRAAPYLMKTLSVLGTAAMFLVGGGIVVHGIPWLHHTVEHAVEWVRHGAGLGGVVGGLSGAVLNGLCGLVAGALVLGVVGGVKKWRGARTGGGVH
jgi:predicted DNA repair protein MutK